MPQRNHRNADNALKALRDLVPHRPLSYSESLRLAELQANRMLELFEIADDRVPSELVTEFPRVDVRCEHDLPVSGSTHWENGRWIITLNADEPWVRRRFSLMHEFKHILDHPTKHYLYGVTDIDGRSAERAADQFAACLLMPKRRLKGLWFESGQSLTRAASRLGVSTRALNVRLYHLGLAESTRRCARTPAAVTNLHRSRYYRAPSLVGVSP